MSDEVTHDPDLLRQYTGGSEAAFRELVQRHFGMVYATARRVLSSAPHLADDVTQNVFTDLAKKAFTLSPEVVLAGWLHRHSYYLALNAARAEHRRLARERTAMEINAVNADAAYDAHWAQLAPVLDEALNHLEPADRDAVVLRYLEQRDLRSVGAAIGVSEDTAQKRVTRALEKLRAFFGSRGITVSSLLLASALEAGARNTTVPQALPATVSATALSTVTSTSYFTALKIMTTTQKIAVSAAALLILAGVGTALFPSREQPAAKTLSTPTAKTPAANELRTRVSSIEAPKLPATKASIASAAISPASPPEIASNTPPANDTPAEQPVQIITTAGTSFQLPNGQMTSLEAGYIGYIFQDGVVILAGNDGMLIPYGAPDTSSPDAKSHLDVVRALSR